MLVPCRRATGPCGFSASGHECWTNRSIYSGRQEILMVVPVFVSTESLIIRDGLLCNPPADSTLSESNTLVVFLLVMSCYFILCIETSTIMITSVGASTRFPKVHISKDMVESRGVRFKVT